MKRDEDMTDEEFSAAVEEFDQNTTGEIADLNTALEASESQVRALRDAITGLLKFHQEGDDGAELPREYWTPGYLQAVEHAEALVGSNVVIQGPPAGGPAGMES